MMTEKEILLHKTLIEIYDRELEGNKHCSSRCPKCKSLIKQRKKMIIKLKEEVKNEKIK
ncbi:MAG TPA: hypothetical protein VMZ91_05370 [Candidatus Paceibacterota bacterium]|nr:hypothetical protein [Candidatus Paceibacterota bacterium]